MEAQAPIVPFDWQRLFLGTDPAGFYLEIMFRSIFMYVFLLFMLRLLSKRTLTQLSILEFGIVIALGSAAGDPTFYKEVPILHGCLVLASIVAFQHVYTWVQRKSEFVETMMEGHPVELVRDGLILPKSLEKARLSQEEFFEMLRQHKVSQLGEIRHAYLEQNGQISVFTLATPVPGLPIVPPWDLEPPELLKAGSHQPPATWVACTHCGKSHQDCQPISECGHCQKELYVIAEIDPLNLGKAVADGGGQ